MTTSNRPGGSFRGGGRPFKFKFAPGHVGMLVGVACEHCGQERLASIPGLIVCLACGKKPELPTPGEGGGRTKCLTITDA